MEFKPEYVRCTWSPELEGEKVLFSDEIELLRLEVSKGEALRMHCKKGSSINYPFKCGEATWRFVYYDPFFDLKLAHEQGKTIQVLQDNIWIDWYNPQWEASRSYRIKPEEENPVTNRELARWLAQGRGECRLCSMGDVSPYAQMAFRYCDKDGFLPVKGIVLVRKWDDKEWHKPTREYMGLD